MRKFIAGIIMLFISHFAWGYQSGSREASAQARLSHLVQTFNNAVRTKSGKQAYERIIAEAEKVKNDHASSQVARMAQYYIALSEENLGHTAKAIRDLEELIQTDDASVKALAQFALASLYKNHGETAKALAIYDQLSESGAASNSKTHQGHHADR